MVHHPLKGAIQLCHPMVSLGDGIYAKTRGDRHDEALLVSAMGVEHPLRRLFSFRTLMEHYWRLNRSSLLAELNTNLHNLNALQQADPLMFFLSYLGPLFLQRDWDEEYQASVSAKLAPLQDSFENTLFDFPFPIYPSPALWVMGRAWSLEEGDPFPGAVHIKFRQICLILTGKWISVGSIEKEFKAQVANFVKDTAATMAAQAVSAIEPERLSLARDELSGRGFLQMGDALLIQDGDLRLGHVIPPHYNKILDEPCNRDLAVTTRFQVPPVLDSLNVYRLSDDERWRRLDLPHGLCLGTGPRASIRDPSGLEVLAYLRWASVRIAVNQRFHEND